VKKVRWPRKKVQANRESNKSQSILESKWLLACTTKKKQAMAEADKPRADKVAILEIFTRHRSLEAHSLA
jgi:hypothetical protein